MASNITNCGTCGDLTFCNWYGKDAPKDRYGRIDRDWMDSNPTAYCSEHCRDMADKPNTHLINDTVDGGAVVAIIRATTEALARDIWFNDLTTDANLIAVAYENSTTNGDPFNGWIVNISRTPPTDHIYPDKNAALAGINRHI